MKKVTAFIGTSRRQHTYYAVHRFLDNLRSLGGVEYEIIALTDHRVEALLRQLEVTGTQDRQQLLFHRRLLDNELPLSIGDGIGQSRLCMYYLRKAHIGEIQVSICPPEMMEKCKSSNIFWL